MNKLPEQFRNSDVPLDIFPAKIQGWAGKLDTKDPASMERMNAYIKATPKNPAVQISNLSRKQETLSPP